MPIIPTLGKWWQKACIVPPNTNLKEMTQCKIKVFQYLLLHIRRGCRAEDGAEAAKKIETTRKRKGLRTMYHGENWLREGKAHRIRNEQEQSKVAEIIIIQAAPVICEFKCIWKWVLIRIWL